MNPVPFNGQSYKKQKELGTSDQSLFRLRKKFKKVIYYQAKFEAHKKVSQDLTKKKQDLTEMSIILMVLTEI